MKIEIKSKSADHIEFFVEREKGQYNNVNINIELIHAETDALPDAQVNQWAWERAKPTVYAVFNRIEPLDEPENFLDFEVEPIPVDPFLVLQPTQAEISKAEREIETINLLIDLGVIV
jgi:hypothetical protein